jgi:hypothetical protein
MGFQDGCGGGERSNPFGRRKYIVDGHRLCDVLRHYVLRGRHSIAGFLIDNILERPTSAIALEVFEEELHAHV